MLKFGADKTNRITINSEYIDVKRVKHIFTYQKDPY